jgi:hypothetical protein
MKNKQRLQYLKSLYFAELKNTEKNIPTADRFFLHAEEQAILETHHLQAQITAALNEFAEHTEMSKVDIGGMSGVMASIYGELCQFATKNHGVTFAKFLQLRFNKTVEQTIAEIVKDEQLSSQSPTVP